MLTKNKNLLIIMDIVIRACIKALNIVNLQTNVSLMKVLVQAAQSQSPKKMDAQLIELVK